MEISSNRLVLAFVSNTGRPFGLAQAAVSGVILLQSYVFVVQGDRVQGDWGNRHTQKYF
jgi:hypothetical protein